MNYIAEFIASPVLIGMLVALLVIGAGVYFHVAKKSRKQQINDFMKQVQNNNGKS